MNVKEIKEKLVNEKTHDFGSLRQLTAMLRGPEGCPWDREQDHKTIRSDIIEETYEVAEAIDNDDAKLLKEELGDVLFQVMFHSRISEENGDFSIDDVIQGIVDKMIVRHPHVFGDTIVASSGEVLDNWETIKRAEKSRDTLEDVLNAVPKQYPALMRTKKLIKKARKNGIDAGSDCENTEKMKSLVAALEGSEGAERQKILNEIIFCALLLCAPDSDPERDLAWRADRFIKECIGKAEEK